MQIIGLAAIAAGLYASIHLVPDQSLPHQWPAQLLGAITQDRSAPIAANSSNVPTPSDSTIFPDVQDDVYATEIDAAVSQKVIQGFEDGTFHPQKPITRQEAATLVLNALTAYAGVNAVPVFSQISRPPFPDVPATQWSAPQVLAGKAIGMVRGDDVGLFRPQDTVTRAEFMAMLLGSIQYGGPLLGKNLSPEPNLPPSPFSDLGGHWSMSAISTLASYCPGVATPLNETGNEFAPDTPALRNYAAAATMRAMNCLQQ